MSKNIENLTLANLYYIRDVATPASKLRINQENLDKIMRGKALILGTPVESFGCWSCSARSYFKVGASVLDQYKQEVLDRIAELEAVELSQTLYYVDNSIEDEEVITNFTQEYNESDEVSDDVIEEKIVSMESSENEISVTTVKRGRKPKDEE
jgi:hypothetical protein